MILKFKNTMAQKLVAFTVLLLGHKWLRFIQINEANTSRDTS